MIIVGQRNGHRHDFLIGAHVKDGRIVKVDRAARFLRGWSIGDVLALANKRGWTVQLNPDEREQMARAGVLYDDGAVNPPSRSSSSRGTDAV